MKTEGMITMDRAEAIANLREYRDANRRRVDEEWKTVETALEKLANGSQVIDVRRAILSAPRDDEGRPLLAIARSDRKECKFSRRGHASNWIFATSIGGLSWWSSFVPTMDVSVLGADRGVDASGFALVPLVPPKVWRNVRGRKAGKKAFWILWEVEQWAERRILAAPDIDPILLRPIAGDLYEIVGSWDLTEVERAVMRARN